MREEGPPAQEDVGSVPRQLLEPLEERLVDAPRAELVDQLVVVDRELLSVARHGALDVPRRYDLLVRRVRGGFDRGGIRSCRSDVSVSPG